MWNILKVTKFLLFGFLVMALASCNESDNTRYISGNNSIVNYIENHAEYSMFLEAINLTERYTELDGNSGSYTLLLPDDCAMEAFLEDKGKSSLKELDSDELDNLVNYHLLDIESPVEALITGYQPTLATAPVNDSVYTNLSLLIENDFEEVKFNGDSEIVEADISLDNGILHKISDVLALPTIQTFMQADENLQPFYQKLLDQGGSTDFEALLSNPNKKTTLLVPDAFAITTFEEGKGKEVSNKELQRMLGYHVLVENTTFSTVAANYLPTTTEENYSAKKHSLPIYLNKEEGLFINGDVGVTMTDLMTINGTIQVLDSFLTLPSILDFIKADPDFSEFHELLERAEAMDMDYVKLLNNTDSQSPFTVFIPSNAEIDKLAENYFPERENPTLDDLKSDDLKAIIDLHIVERKGLRSADFTSGNLQMKKGQLIMDASEKELTDPLDRKAVIEEMDIQTTNGVLHKIDKVLLPKTR